MSTSSLATLECSAPSDAACFPGHTPHGPPIVYRSPAGILPAMADLNSRDDVRHYDPQNMLGLIEAFPEQCEAAIRLATEAALSSYQQPTAVFLIGMGGSAAGGDFVRALFESEGPVPFLVNREYSLPAYVNGQSLVIAASYSGNTEETLSAYEDAKGKGARILAITSGGELARRAEQDGFDVITVPGGQPPRSALGWLLMPALVALTRIGLLGELPFDAMLADLRAVRANLGVDSPDNFAKELAQKFHGRIGVVYGLGSVPGLIANRWRCQFNENAKYLLFNNVFPELCHNEIMGWEAARLQAPKFHGVILADDQPSVAMATRARVTAEVIGADLCEFTTVYAQGQHLLSRMLTLAYTGDWVSIYLARLNEVDAVEIAGIDRLKEALATIPA